MKKAIVMIRVSTEKQSLDEQSLQLKERAKQDGYKTSEIEIIEEKESGIKLSDEERKS
jgi:DNA invertase Pin-like site-specific DNA recombinase